MTDLLAGWTQQQLRAAAGSTAAPLPPAAPSAAVPTGPSPVVLQIPRIDLDLVVVDGVSRDDLRRGPGILPGTPVPGGAGNSVVAGHRNTWGGPFNRLDELRPGDRISAGPADDVAEYTVVPPQGTGPADGHRIVSPTDRTVARQDLGVDRITLVTCHPHFSAAQRLVVIADRTEPTSPPPSGPAAPLGDVPDLGQLDFGYGRSPQWSEVVPSGATALLIWAVAGVLSTGPAHRPRWRRVLRWVGWRLTGAALAAVPLLVAFNRLSDVWPTG